MASIFVGIASAVQSGYSTLKSLHDKAVTALEEMDATFESDAFRAENYWRSNEMKQYAGENGDVLVYDTIIQKTKAPGRRGNNLAICVPPQAPFQRENDAMNAILQQQKAARVVKPLTPFHDCVMTQPKSSDAPEMLISYERPSTPYLSTCTKQEVCSRNAFREAVILRLPSPTMSEIETLLSPTSSNEEQEDDISTSSQYYSEASRCETCVRKSPQIEEQAADIWLDVFHQETNTNKANQSAPSKLSPMLAANKVDTVDFAAVQGRCKLIEWIDELPTDSFWDEM